MKYHFLYIAFVVAVSTLVSCQSEENPSEVKNDTKELIVAAEATDIGLSSATLFGYANIQEGMTDVKFGVIVSEDQNPNVENGKIFFSKELDSNNKFYCKVTCLVNGRKYYYKACLKEGDYYRTSSKTLSFTTKDYFKDIEIEAIDLGLSVKWASINLGATKPEEYGDYYAWGEIEPKEDFWWSNYKWSLVSDSDRPRVAKYNNLGIYGIVDNKTVLDSEDDAAHINLGGKWRMPTDAEWTDLREKCKWTWTTQNGVNGYIVTGPSGKSIFLPAAGYRYSSLGLQDSDSKGRYWSSSLHTGVSTEEPWCVDFVSGDVHRNYELRDRGLSVRPIYDEKVDVESVSLDNTTLKLEMGATAQLTATILPSNAFNRTVSWTSDNEAVATVSHSGVVTANRVGKCTITVKTEDGEKTAICAVTVRYRAPEAVDLGLSVKWASFNLGASKPNECGDYFAWGETEPYYSSQDPLTWEEGKDAGYSFSSYNWCMGSNTTMTKYCCKSGYGYNGFTDTKTVLDPEDDAAHVNLGGKWRIPTDAEWTELREKCKWTWTTQNGVNGYKVTGPSGKSIFLPIAGDWDGTNLYNVGSRSYYWSSSLDTDYPYFARYVFLLSDTIYRDSSRRCNGFSVRSVSE